MSRPSKWIKRHSAFAPLRQLAWVQPEARWDPDWFGTEEPDPVWEKFTPVTMPEDHPAKRHWGWGQNDAQTLKCRIVNGSLSLTVNHYDFERLAYILCFSPGLRYSRRRRSYLGYPPQYIRKSFPVTFTFCGITEWMVVRTVEQGLHQKLRSSALCLDDRLLDVARLECVQYSSSLQRHILQLNGSKPFRRGTGKQGAYNNTFLVSIECREVEVEDGTRLGWERLFKGEHLNLYEAFDQIWPLTGWGVAQIENWVVEQGAGDLIGSIRC